LDAFGYNERMDSLDLWQDFDLTISVDDVLLGQGADPEKVRANRPVLVKAAERALEEGRTRIHPTALVRELNVLEHRHERIKLEGGGELSGPLVSRHLGGATHVAAAVCTLGPALEISVAKLMGSDPGLALALDGYGNAAVEQVGQQVCGRLGDWASAKGLQSSTPLSPGSPEWPVEIGQPQIFGLLDTGRAGIQITQGGMMYPQKSISFVAGIGTGMSQTHPCEVCSLKEICRYRHG
jgi:hypothetical protein